MRPPPADAVSTAGTPPPRLPPPELQVAARRRRCQLAPASVPSLRLRASGRLKWLAAVRPVTPCHSPQRLRAGFRKPAGAAARGEMALCRCCGGAALHCAGAARDACCGCRGSRRPGRGACATAARRAGAAAAAARQDPGGGGGVRALRRLLLLLLREAALRRWRLGWRSAVHRRRRRSELGSQEGTRVWSRTRQGDAVLLACTTARRRPVRHPRQMKSDNVTATQKLRMLTASGLP